MDELDETLNEMKKEYERLPEYTTTKSISSKLKHISKWKKVSPIFTVAAGVILFILLIFPYNEDDNASNYLELYFYDKKDAFRKNMGIDHVDTFENVKKAEKLVEESESKQTEDLAGVKEEIDLLLSTPKELAIELNQEGELLLGNEQFSEKMLDMETSLQGYYSELLKENNLNNEDQHNIVKAQDNIHDYQGPAEISYFLNMLHEQGFRIVRLQNGTNAMKIQVDYQWVYEHNNNVKEFEGYQRYLELSATMIDHRYPGVHNEFEIPWTEFDTILLEIEKLYNEYPEERELLFQELNLASTAKFYLSDYITAGKYETLGSSADTEMVEQMGREELMNFIKSHKDSRYWGAVHHFVRDYEENGWLIEESFILDTIWYLFDERFNHINHDDVTAVRSWPIIEETSKIYKSFQEEKNFAVLHELTSLEILSIYLLAIDRDNVELSHILEAETSKVEKMEHPDWFQLAYEADAVLVASQGKNWINYQFIRGISYADVSEPDIIAEIKLSKEDKMWKISDMKIE